MKSVRIRPLADSDIDAALSYLAARNPAAASRLLTTLQQALEALARTPAIGSLRYAHVLPTLFTTSRT